MWKVRGKDLQQYVAGQLLCQLIRPANLAEVIAGDDLCHYRGRDAEYDGNEQR
jgi:hypothetical protein